MRSGRVEVYEEKPATRRVARPRRNNLIRFLIFLLVFTACSVVSLVYVYDRPPLYESRASVLITPPSAEEGGSLNSAAESGLPGVGSGIVGIERYQLLATPLLSRLLDLLNQDDTGPGPLPANLAELRKIISVEQFEATSIVALRAAGSDPDLLPVIVNSWLELYRESQSQHQQSSASDENARLSSQAEELQSRIESKRAEIQAFRSRHDIVSMEREENALLARLKGITKSLNAAKEEEFNAQGELDSIVAALNSGKPVIDLQNQRRMANLEQRLTALQEQIKEIEQRFTKRFIDLDPNIQAVLRQRDLIEEQIAGLREEAARTVLAAAEQRVASARVAVVGLEVEFGGSKRQIAEFSARFAEHEALVSELDEMEVAYRQAKDRLLRREVNVERGITKVEILESAVLPTEPIWPDYRRDAAIGVGGSLLLGILTVLLFDFFVRPSRASESDPGPDFERATLIRTGSLPTLESADMAHAEIEASPPLAAVSYQPPSRVLEETEIDALMRAGDNETRLIIGLLLSGVAIDRIAALRCGDIDCAAALIMEPSQPDRRVAMPEALRAGFERQLAGTELDDPLWHDHEGQPRSREDLEALITMAAHDAGLAEPEQASAGAILHSYLVYLVKQGMRLADVEVVTGPIAPSVRAAYAEHAPAGTALPIDQVETLYPSLRSVPPA